MKEIQAHLAKIRSDAAECVMLSNLVADGKREVFARTAEHLSALAREVEKTILANGADNGTRGEGVNIARPEAREEAVATDVAAAHHQQAARPRRMLPWLLAAVLGGIVGAFFWAKYPANEYWPSLALQSKHEASPAPQDETKQAVATLRSDVQEERRILTEQLSALVARVDNLVTALDNLKTTHIEAAGHSNKEFAGEEEKPPAAETKPPAPEERPARRDENRTSALENPALEKPSDGILAATETPLAEHADRVGTVPIPPRRVQPDPRRLSMGPPGCTHFRSFDPVSGTYTTLEGRRRPCRQ